MRRILISLAILMLSLPLMAQLESQDVQESEQSQELISEHIAAPTTSYQSGVSTSSDKTNGVSYMVFGLITAVLTGGLVILFLQSSSLKKEVKTLNGRIESRKAEISDMKLTLTNFNDKINSLATKMSKLETPNSELSSNIKQLIDEAIDSRNGYMAQKVIQESVISSVGESLDEVVTDGNKGVQVGLTQEDVVNGNTLKVDNRPILYFKYPSDGVVRKTYESSDDCFYKMTLNSETDAEFEFCGDESYALDNMDAVLNSASVIESKVPGPKFIETIEKGLIRQDGSSWTIVTKAKIKLV